MNTALSFPAISDFLKDTFSESLKRPLQPAGLFTSAIFLFFNLLLVLPMLAERDVAVATIFFGLSVGWQLAISTGVTLTLAYVLVALSSNILGLLSGESWEDSLVGRWGWTWQVRKRDQLDQDFKRIRAKVEANAQDKDPPGISDGEKQRRRIQAARDQALLLQKTWQVSTRFPDVSDVVGSGGQSPDRRSRLAPTALGNVLRAIASYIATRYGADMTALWPHMETAIADQTGLTSRINNEKASLDFLLNMTFMLTVLALELAALQLVYRRWPDAVLIWVFLLLAYLFYRAAVVKAVGWGAAVELAFDLHREKLRKALVLREFKTKADERKVWTAVSAWLLWGRECDHVFEEQPAPKATLTDRLSTTASSNIEVTYKHLALDSRRFPTDGPQQVVAWEEFASYYFMINAVPRDKQQTLPVEGAILIVSDSGVKTIETAPLAVSDDWPNAVPNVTVLQSDPAIEPAQLLWRLPEISAQESRSLRYELILRRIRITVSSPGLSILETVEELDQAPELRYGILVSNDGNEAVDDAILMLSDTRIDEWSDVKAFIIRDPAGSDMDMGAPSRVEGGGGYWIPLGSIAAGESLAVNYEVALPDEAEGS